MDAFCNWPITVVKILRSSFSVELSTEVEKITLTARKIFDLAMVSKLYAESFEPILFSLSNHDNGKLDQLQKMFQESQMVFGYSLFLFPWTPLFFQKFDSEQFVTSFYEKFPAEELAKLLTKKSISEGPDREFGFPGYADPGQISVKIPSGGSCFKGHFCCCS